MKYLILYLFTLLFFLTACQNTSDKQPNDPANLKTTVAFFSDTTKMDTFKVVLQGKKPKDMLLTFNIVTGNGKEIYKKVFKASDLINNYQETLDLSKEKSQRDFIQQEFNLFLEEENFLWPALTPEQKPDRQSPDLAFFKELQDSQLNGFQYRLTKETKVYIAWSGKHQQVKIYYKCC